MTCQPVQVEWGKNPPPSPSWTLGVWCAGCGTYREVHVADSVARNVELAERFEQDVLAELHAPEPDLPF